MHIILPRLIHLSPSRDFVCLRACVSLFVVRVRKIDQYIIITQRTNNTNAHTHGTQTGII